MIINNKDLATKIRFGFMIGVLFYLAILVLSFVFNWDETHKFPLYWSILFFIAMLFFFLKGYNYIFFSPDGSKIILRYMPLQPFLYGTYSIEIPKQEFVKYEVKTTNFGLRTSIILYQKTERGLSKYRPISLASLQKSERRDMLEVLDRLAR
jgi:hypothetical protein